MEQPWTFTLVHGEAHPDHAPPLTTVAPASEEAAAKEEAAMNAEYAKTHDQVAAEPKAEAPNVEPQNLEDHTVAELKAIAEDKGIKLNWDDTKADIIKAIKKKS